MSQDGDSRVSLGFFLLPVCFCLPPYTLSKVHVHGFKLFWDFAIVFLFHLKKWKCCKVFRLLALHSLFIFILFKTFWCWQLYFVHYYSYIVICHVLFISSAALAFGLLFTLFYTAPEPEKKIHSGAFAPPKKPRCCILSTIGMSCVQYSH